MHILCPLLFGQSQELVRFPLPTEIISIYFYSWLLSVSVLLCKHLALSELVLTIQPYR